MSHDQLSLTSRSPMTPALRPLAPVSPPLAAKPASPVKAFQADSYSPSAQRQVGSTQMIADEIQALRERLVQLQARLEAVIAQLEAAPPTPLDAPEHQDDMPVTPDGTVDHSQMAMDTESLKAEFAETDRDQSGDLNFDEIVAHEDGDEAKAELHFTDADRNENQVVDEGEWVWHHQNSPLHTGKNAAA